MCRQSEKGMALPLVLVVALVLTLLGGALLQYAVTDTIHVARDEKTMQAYYLARSGAAAVAQHLIDSPQVAPTLINAPKSDSVTIDNGEFDVIVYGNPGTEVIIESTGTVDGVSVTASLSVAKLDLFDVALYGNTIDFGGNAKINGNIIYKDSFSLSGSAILNGEDEQDPYMSYPDAPFPADVGLTLLNSPSGNVHLTGGNNTLEVTTDSRANEIRLNSNNASINVRLGSGTPQDRILKVSNFQLNGGDLVLHGTGRLLLYVDTFVGGGNFIHAPGSDADVIVFVAEDGLFNMGGTPEFQGAVYGPKATVDLTGTVVFNGSIIADEILGGGNTTVSYAEISSDNLPLQYYAQGVWR